MAGRADEAVRGAAHLTFPLRGAPPSALKGGEGRLPQVSAGANTHRQRYCG
jgi:hypothetical protein